MQPRYQAIEELLRNLPRGPVVDIGFGAGESLEVLAREGFAPLAGYELDADAFERGRRRMEALGLSCQLWMKDATHLEEIPDSSLALIHSRSAFQYFRFYELANSVSRKLRIGGHLVVMVPSLHYYFQWKSYVPGKYLALSHSNPLTVSSQGEGEVWRGRGPQSVCSEMWRLVSYPRAICRTLLLIASGSQPNWGGSTPEIGWTMGLVQRFARCAEMETVTLLRRGWMLEAVLRKIAAR